MVIYIVLLLTLLAPPLCAAEHKAVRGANPWGFFAEFLWAVNHLEWCKANNLTPVIHWGKDFAYYHPEGYNGSLNGWEYYFESVSHLNYEAGDRTHHELYYKRDNNFTALSEYCQYIDTLDLLPPEERKFLHPIENHHAIYLSSKYDYARRPPSVYPVGKQHLYSTSFRNSVKREIIDPFIKIKPSIAKKINDFYTAHMASKKIVGIHLRGQHIGGEVLPVPLTAFFAEANKYAALGYQFFIATDQFTLIDQARKALHGPVICYECQRFDKTTSPYPGKKLDPKLGEDLLIEALLLSQCDHFIHTLSNVSTAVLYFNPNLTHTLLY